MMRKLISAMGVGVLVGAAVAPAAGQSAVSARLMSQERDQRYQISTMERVLEGAVEHGAQVTRDRLQALLPADMLLSDKARVRGYRLENYGLFFDVAVPMLEGSLTWSFRTLDQNDLGLQSALTALRSVVAKTGDINAEQALKRIELQVAPVSLNAGLATTPAAPTVSGARNLTGSAAVSVATTDVVQAAQAAQSTKSDPILDDPVEAFRAEIRDALMNAMLDHGAALRLTANDLLTVAARGSDDRSMLGPLNDEAQTTMLTVRGADLAAYLSGQISREEVRERIAVRVF
jgi:hypothetical protein